MIKQRIPSRFLMILTFILVTANGFAQDENFHIYLCFGQSNMEGMGTIQSQDQTVDERFKVFQSLDCSNLNRNKENWYTAVPPLCNCWSKLTPADYFGRTMVANLPENITIGVVNVAVGGCDIRLFDKDLYQDYDDTYNEDWFLDKIAAYDGNPYAHLINLAQQAQQDGVIKGILLHQGETNTGQSEWPSYVKKIYEDILSDLSLSAESVPLIAGEVLAAEGSCCSSMNTIINTLPQTIPTSYVISSEGCGGMDNAHFNSEGYRILGKRYAVKMLSLMGYETSYCEPECGTVGENWRIQEDSYASNEGYITATPGLENISDAPTDDASFVTMNFNVSADGEYYIYGRFKNLAAEDDSYWLKIDDGAFELLDGLTTSTWEWLELKSQQLSAGEHTISISFGEDGGYFDKLAIKNSQITPVELGEEANNICEPDFYIASGLKANAVLGYSLEQNYPNPSDSGTSIVFEIPIATFVSLKIFDAKGAEIMELAGKKFNSGKHKLELDFNKLRAGKYFYTIKAGEYTATRKMIVTDK